VGDALLEQPLASLSRGELADRDPTRDPKAAVLHAFGESWMDGHW